MPRRGLPRVPAVSRLEKAVQELAAAVEREHEAFRHALHVMRVAFRDPRDPVALDVYEPTHLRYPSR